MPKTKTPPRAKRAPASSALRRARLLRWIAGALALVAVALAVGVGALVLLLPSERIAREASTRAEAALGVPVGIGGVELDLWPAPAVALQGARIGREGGSEASVGRVVLRPRLLPLLLGQVSVRQIDLERPHLRLEVGRDGRLHFPFPEQSGAGPGGADVEFSIDELRIREGRLAYRDARDGTSVRLGGIEQRLRIQGEVRGGELVRVGLRGVLAVDSADADLPGRLGVPVRGMRISVAHAGSLDRQRDQLDLQSLRVQLQRIALEGSGRVESLSDSAARRVTLELRAPEFSAEDLLASLPEGLLGSLLSVGRSGTAPADAPPAERPVVDGRVSIQARVQGLATRDSLPRVEGVVRLAELGTRVRGRPVLEGLTGTVGFSNEVVSTRELSGRLFQQPFRLAFRVQGLSAPVIAFSTAGSVPLDEVVLLAGMQDSLSASGRVPFELQGNLLPAEPARSELGGVVELGGVQLARPSLRQGVHIASGRLRFSGGQIRAEGVQVGFGESRLRAEATVAHWLPSALGDSTQLPEVRFDLAAALLDLDALLGPSESTYTPLLFARLADRPVNGQSAAEAAAAAGLTLPDLPRVHASGRLRAERLLRNGLEYHDLDAQVESAPEGVRVPRARFGLMGGTVELGLALHRGATDGLLAVDYRLENVGAEPFFSRLTPFQGRLSGALAMRGSAVTQLDEHLLPVRPTVQASGELALTDGALASWPVLRAAGERLGIARLDTIGFREWSGTYQIAGPLVTLERASQVGGKIETEAAGSFDFGGRLDLGVLAHLPPDLAARAGQPVRRAAAAAAAGDGRIPLGLRITGSTASPQIELDLAAARGNAVAQARDKARGAAQQAADAAAREVAGRVLPDSVPLRPDSVAGAVHSQVTERLQGLFRRRAPAAPQPADTTARADSVAAAGG